VAILVGLVEVLGGLALVVGVAPRAVALVLAGNMVGALATAGRIDGGQNIWLPIVLLVVLAAVVARGGGTPRLEPRYPGSSEISSRRPKVR
jgi:putative oxidoreductase